MRSFILIGFLIAVTLGVKVTATVKYDDSDDPDYPCYWKDVIEFDGSDGVLQGMRYKESKDGDWKYSPAEGIALDPNENILMCHDEEPSESISPECVSYGAADDFDFSMMSDGISYKDKTLTMDYNEGHKVWSEHIKDMEDEMDVTIYDAQNV